MRIAAVLCLCTLFFAPVTALAGRDRAPAWDLEDKQIEGYNEAIEALNAQDLRLAETRANAVLRDQPRCGAALNLLVIAKLRQGELEEARAVTEEMINLFPDVVDVHLTASDVYFALQDFDGALTQGQLALALAPDELAAMQVTQRALVRLGRYDDARTLLAAVRDPEPEITCLEILLLADQGRTEEAVRLLDTCRLADEDMFVAAAEGAVGSSTGDLDAVIRSNVELDVTSPVDVMQGVLALIGESDFAAAEALLTDEVVATSPQLLRTRGWLRAAQGQDGSALRDLERAFGTAGSWIKVHESGNMTGVLTWSAAQAEASSALDAASLYIRLLAEAGELRRAREALTLARESFGEALELDIAELSLLLVAEGPSHAWNRLDAMLRDDQGASELVDATHRLFAADPTGTTPSARAALLATGNPTDVYNVAWSLAETEDVNGCAELLAPRLDAFSGELATSSRRLAYTCAVEARRLDLAQGVYDTTSNPSALDPASRFNHALALRQSDHLGEASRILSDIDDAKMAREVANMQLGIALAREDWTSVTAQLKAGGAPVQSQLHAASQLYQNGEVEALRTVLPHVCARASGDDRDACEGNLAAIGL